MRRQIKNGNSEIQRKGLIYPNNSRRISKILYSDQKGFCAYTEEFIERTDAEDIEHFDPTLKEEPTDGYENWFLVKHLWNIEKSAKWENFQPILYPTATDFEQRVVYNDGNYFANPDDIEAVNLVKLLNLDDPVLTANRKKFIKNKREKFETYGFNLTEHFNNKATNDPSSLKYLRALNEEFGIDVWSLIPSIRPKPKKMR